MIGRKNRQRNTLKKLAIGSSIAAAAGYVAGVLTAPKSGKQTRNDIKSAADKGVAEAEKDLKKIHTELDKVTLEAKSTSTKLSAKAQKELDLLVTKAKESKLKAREVLKAIRAGDANDKDLQRAVKDASAALKHLRDYLKK